jgi:hypothetical protein
MFTVVGQTKNDAGLLKLILYGPYLTLALTSSAFRKADGFPGPSDQSPDYPKKLCLIVN